VQRVRVLSCPSWRDSEGFDVIAKAENPDATEDQIRQMLQTLLLERLKLVVRREKHEMEMYARADSTADKNLRRPICAPRRSARRAVG
jgi:uncharacterized protein (TIGR03435 family)